MKLYWKVSPAPTGKYKSFMSRGWPSAYSDKKETNIIANISCADDYIPANVKIGRHASLKIRLAIKNGTSFDWKTLKGEFLTLDQAKEAAESFYNSHKNLFRSE